MRQLIFAVIVFMIIGTGWVFYLQHNDNKFQESLPKAPISPPVSATQEIKSLETPQVSEVLKQQAPVELPTPGTNSEEKKESLSEAETYTQKLYKDMTSEFIETPIELTDSDNRTDSELSKPWLKPIAEMSLTEIRAEVKRRREALIDTFGDTPEVALVNKYTTVESLRDGRVTLDREDGLAYIRAISVLWPEGQNPQVVKELEEMQRNGWHVNSKKEFQNLPGIE